MTDDWCLRKHLDEIHIEFYEPEEVETLRRRLIEDIINMSDFSGCNSSVKERLIDCVNRRFGYE